MLEDLEIGELDELDELLRRTPSPEQLKLEREVDRIRRRLLKVLFSNGVEKYDCWFRYNVKNQDLEILKKELTSYILGSNPVHTQEDIHTRVFALSNGFKAVLVWGQQKQKRI